MSGNKKWWEKRYDPGSSMYRHYKALDDLGFNTEKKEMGAVLPREEIWKNKEKYEVVEIADDGHVFVKIKKPSSIKRSEPVSDVESARDWMNRC